MSPAVSDILQEVRKLTPEERRELAEALLEEGQIASIMTGDRGDREGQVAGVDVRRQRLEWLKAHRSESGGQYVALDGVALVATGRSYREAKENAFSAGKPDVFITYLPKPNEVAEMIG